MFEHMAMWTWPDAVRTENPRRMVDRLRAARVDILTVFVDSRSEGDERKRYEERLRAIVAEAHRRGLQVHACFDKINSYPAMPVHDLRQVRRDGSMGTALCPANPEVVQYILGQLERVLTGFDHDGVNLEDGYVFHHSTIYDPANQIGVEYRVIPVCYCDYCRKHAPIEKPEWPRWKQERLTALIEEEAKLIRRLKPGIPFSVAARMPYDRAFYTPYRNEIPYYGGWEFCQSRDGFAADWAEWLRRGHIDFACPMSYFHSGRMVQLQTMECQRLFPQAATQIWMGLGLGECNAEYCQGYSDDSNPSTRRFDPALINDAETLTALLEDQARMGQKNCIFFSYQFLLDEHLPVLAKFRQR